jgi:hypothetical protein
LDKKLMEFQPQGQGRPDCQMILKSKRRFGAAAYQYANVIGEVGEEEGIARLKDTSYKRVIEWMSKAWSTDQLKN